MKTREKDSLAASSVEHFFSLRKQYIATCRNKDQDSVQIQHLRFIYFKFQFIARKPFPESHCSRFRSNEQLC